jgi:beta-glucosidase
MTIARTLCIFILTAFVLVAHAQEKAVPPYKNPKLPVEKRVKDLLSRMTLEEKLWQLFMGPPDPNGKMDKLRHGIFGLQLATEAASNKISEQILRYESSGTARAAAERANAMQRFFVNETRLGIPIIPFDEALHGLVRGGATSFPQSIALAATWDTALVSNVAHAVAVETKTRGIRQILSPVVNMATDVRWGRVEETYGEDPCLSSEMGVAFVSEFEKLGVITTPKHFVANHGDGGRDSYPIHWTERYLDEIYFPAFEACFHAGGSRSVMTSYNAVDGRPNTANSWLLKKKLKGDWGFRGFVITDAGSVGGMNDLHHTSTDYSESMKQGVENGLDVIFQTSLDHFDLFFGQHLKNKSIDPKAVDEAVTRVLRAKFELGLFENPYVDPAEAEKWNGHADHRALSGEAAREAIVLLKNQHNILPLARGLGSIAIIGSDAVEARLGGYSGPGNKKVSILEGIKQKLGVSTNVKYVEGCKRVEPEAATIPVENLRCANGKGLLASYWSNPDFSGNPVVQRVEPELQARWALFAPDLRLSNDWFSARWEGELIAPKTGALKIGLEGNDGYRLYVSDSLLIDNWEKASYRTILSSINVVQGQAYGIKIEYRETTGFGRMRLAWDLGVNYDWQRGIDQAVDAAKTADVAVVVVGLIEGESMDRASLALPGHQPELVQAVAATGKPVIVVIVGGSAVTMDGWLDRVDGIVDAWYPGEDGGHAVADVLFGDYNPAGRLPVTFPLAVGQVPLNYNHKPTGRTDYYVDLPGQPLFPFGFGLSYTTFAYSDLKFDKASITKNESLRVRLTVKNSGAHDGDEVVQLYLKNLLAGVTRPILELKAFQRVHLKAGETREVTFAITPEMLTMLNKNMKRVIEPGDFRVMVGASSADIRLHGTFKVL